MKYGNDKIKIILYIYKFNILNLEQKKPKLKSYNYRLKCNIV